MVLFLAACEGCASIWGFEDLTQSSGTDAANVADDARAELANDGEATRDDSPMTTTDAREPDASIDSSTTMDASLRPDVLTAFDASGDSCALVQHSDGLGQSFDDCVPLGMYNSQLANDACMAAEQFPSVLSLRETCNGADEYVICCSQGPLSACWDYQGLLIGHVCSGSYPCCPSSSDPTYE
jgi:hypothetical protein